MDGSHFDSLVRSLAMRPARGSGRRDAVVSFAVDARANGVARKESRTLHPGFAGNVSSCAPGRVLCDGVCINPWWFEHDARNCGGCGIVCGHGAVCCDGHCVDLTADSANCGVCGARCAPGSVCAAGECT
jgi:hypothetical protein